MRMIAGGFPVITKLQISYGSDVIRTALIIESGSQFGFRYLKGKHTLALDKAQKLWNSKTGFKTEFAGVIIVIQKSLPFSGSTKLQVKNFSSSKNIAVLIIQIACNTKIT